MIHSEHSRTGSAAPFDTPQLNRRQTSSFASNRSGVFTNFVEVDAAHPDSEQEQHITEDDQPGRDHVANRRIFAHAPLRGRTPDEAIILDLHLPGGGAGWCPLRIVSEGPPCVLLLASLYHNPRKVRERRKTVADRLSKAITGYFSGRIIYIHHDALKERIDRRFETGQARSEPGHSSPPPYAVRSPADRHGFADAILVQPLP